jgi:5-methylcytosine-specific restriction enzyme A
LAIPYEVGQTYHRKTDLHGPYGGSHQSGISSCSQYPFIFLFSAPTGERHGYVDEFHDGLFWYTGAGQSGDMTFERGNLAIKNHIENQKHLLLFEMERKGYYRYMGEAVYVGHHSEMRLDSNDQWRSAIIFELALSSLPAQVQPQKQTKISRHAVDKLLVTAPLQKLRTLALNGASEQLPAKNISTTTYVRSEAIRRYALARANGVCELCDNPAPFMTSKGKPYLEVHHVSRIADGGPDHPDKVAALCPNCHRKAHFGHERDLLLAELKKRLVGLEG